MRIEYIYNSGFHIETDEHQFLIDYFRGKVELNPDKACLFVVTHGHADHFDPLIFDMARPGDKFIISSDVEIEPGENIFVMQPGQTLEIDGVQFRACGSTDAGISLRIAVSGQIIIHPGDLNLWIWEEDSPSERAEMERDFKREVACLAGNEPVDVLFGVVDGRLQERYLPGPLHLISSLKPKHFIPMHFRDDWEVLTDFSRRSGNPGTRIHLPTSENHVFQID